MKYNLTKAAGYSLATYVHGDNTVMAYISVDIHREQTAVHRATELLYAEALLSGAGKYNRAEFLDALNLLGAHINVSISDGVCTLHIRSSAAAYKKALALVETILREPTFNKTELARIKITVINEIKEGKEDSKAIAKEGLRNSFYGAQDRRYSHTEDTLIQAIALVSTQHLKKLHADLLSTTWICTQGSSKENIALFENVVKKCNRAKPTTKPLGAHNQTPPTPGLTLKNIPSRQNIDFSIGAPLPINMHHPDFAPLVFGLTILGKLGGFTGRLMSTVREAEGLTYGIYAGPETFYREEQGYWRIMTFFSPQQAVQGLTSTVREVTKMYDEGITKEELVKFKRILKTGQVLKNDSSVGLLSELHAYHMQNFSLVEMEEYKQKIFNVTLKEVNDAIKIYLNPRTLTISAAGPVEKIRKELLDFTKKLSTVSPQLIKGSKAV